MPFARIVRVSSIAGVCCLAGAAAAQPANDLCESATPAVLGANPGTLINAEIEASDSSCPFGGGDGPDVFFSFVPPASGAYAFSLCQDNVFFDSIMSIHTGCATGIGNQLACDDDGCGIFADLSEIASVTLMAGQPQPYIIRVTTFDPSVAGNSFVLNITSSSSGACCLFDGSCITTNAVSCEGLFQGTNSACIPSPCPPLGTCCDVNRCCEFTFQAACAGVWALGGSCNPSPCGAPANDLCTGAIPLLLNVPAMGSNCSAGDDQTVSCAFSGPTNTHRAVWYSFTPAHTAAYTFNTCGSSFDTLLAIFSGPCGTLVQIACNDDSSENGNITCPGGNELAQTNSRILSQVLTAGVTYRVVVAAWGFDPEGGPYILSASAVNALGSCCEGANCSQTDLARCTGTFTSGGTCTPTNPCVPSTGACCAGSTCSLTTAAACTGQFRAFAGAGTVCNVFSASNAAQNRTPCCLANYNRSTNPIEPTVQDIFDFLSGYFANDPIANINGSTNPVEPTVQDIFDFLSVYFSGCAG